MPAFPGAIIEQPDGVVKRLEIIMRVRREEEERQTTNIGPPPKDAR